MFRYLLLLLIVIPLAELYVLIEVGNGIGGLATVALCLLTAALGAFLIRWQGLKTLLDAQQSLSRGEFPAEHGIHGLLIGLAGLLLFTPGFITDTVGFLLLVPALRTWLIGRMFLMSKRNHSDIIEAEVITIQHPLNPDNR
ncbi:MAG TPA: FxsA family protein [Mariprofundaceae bacterium]|nr:FxsA family protein [Mariprofundaceae bacterium]